MNRVEIIVKGKVQTVAFRDVVEDIAVNLRIVGFVENIKPRDVRIVAEGSEENIKKFIELIKVKKFPIFVESVNVEYKGVTGEFNDFEIKRGDWHEELGERMDAAGKLLYANLEVSKESLEIGKNMLVKQDMMLEKQDMMLVKQNITINVLMDIKENTSKIPSIVEKI